MINNGHNMEKTNFDAFINAVGSEIQQAQVRLITAANAQMLFHYWKMGNYILYHQQLHGWVKTQEVKPFSFLIILPIKLRSVHN